MIFPHIIFMLDGYLAGTSSGPHGPIGEPFQRSIETLVEKIDEGYIAVLMTWRDTSLVNEWLERVGLGRLLFHQRFQILSHMPEGEPSGVYWRYDA